MGETSKAAARREKAGFFQNYCQGLGIDIGCGGDPLFPEIDKWDQSIDPAQEASCMKGVPDGKYDFVYSSHCLEHLDSPWMALRNWWRILKPGGYLILLLPHRDLYEKKLELPSSFNPDHRWYFLPSLGQPPVTVSLINVLNACCYFYDMHYLQTCREDGEFSIECVVRKT